MRRVKCLPCRTWDWWQVTSEKRCCLIPSGHGNSHLLLGTINIAGPYTVSAASAPWRVLEFGFLFLWVCEAHSRPDPTTCGQGCGILTEKIRNRAYLVNCFLNFHWNDKISVAQWLLKKGYKHRFTISQWCNCVCHSNLLNITVNNMTVVPSSRYRRYRKWEDS